MAARFEELSARQRLELLSEPGTFRPLYERQGSPLLTGTGRLRGLLLAMVATDGHVRGGTFGVAEAAACAEALRRFARSEPERVDGLLLCFDTGGVRVEEGPRALAATSAAGVLLAEWTLMGPPVLQIISGPRGCFGAPAVMAGLPDFRIAVGEARWGLTGPQLLSQLESGTAEVVSAATSASHRHACGDVDVVTDGDPAGVREMVAQALEALQARKRPPVWERMQDSAAWVRSRRATLPPAPDETTSEQRKRRRKFLEYSFRRQWRPDGEVPVAGLAQAAWGRLAGRPALGVVLGPENSRESGVGVEEVTFVLDHLLQVRDLSPEEHALILNCIFCQGHALDVDQEALGLPRVLAECLRSYVGVRLLGHRLISVLGGGTYGAAFLAFAAPSHRILAIRGTRVAPMAPELLRAFQRLKGKRDESGSANLAELIPEVRVVENVWRLPAALREEVRQLEEPQVAGAGAA